MGLGRGEGGHGRVRKRRDYPSEAGVVVVVCPTGARVRTVTTALSPLGFCRSQRGRAYLYR